MAKVSCIIIGAGDVARWHVRTLVALKRTTEIVAFVEPSEISRKAMQDVFAELKHPCPPFYPSLEQLLNEKHNLDAALICSPHNLHFPHTRDCLQAGMDILLEKPMVMNTDEARRLLKLRDESGKLVVIAFPGSLSPAVQKAKNLIAEGTLGTVTAVSAFTHQGWKTNTIGTWRQDPAISGGGFLFDTGSHMVNTVIDLMGDDVARVTALLDNRGMPVEINSTVSGISKNGIVFSLTGAGDSIQCCSNITVFGDRGVLETGIWGERLLLRSAGESEFKPISYPDSQGPWEQFLKVRDGRMENPCPPEVGLRFSILMDMIRRSADTGMCSAPEDIATP